MKNEIQTPVRYSDDFIDELKVNRYGLSSVLNNLLGFGCSLQVIAALERQIAGALIKCDGVGLIACDYPYTVGHYVTELNLTYMDMPCIITPQYDFSLFTFCGPYNEYGLAESHDPPAMVYLYRNPPGPSGDCPFALLSPHKPTMIFNNGYNALCISADSVAGNHNIWMRELDLRKFRHVDKPEIFPSPP